MISETIQQDIQQRLQSHKTLYLRIKVIPKADKTNFVEILNDQDKTVKIKVNAIPEKNKANKTLLKFLEKTISCQAELIHGHTSNIKLVRLSI